ncbi:GLPGLI family protein [uncultured Aquimarina sp.]|uniref:GLPGLI family protein n=1 Tax=uncultured Aquimarina sp. TaxID=575652 RepID=UPI0026152F5B|nr:GLPGLI family protein [uncultured Aquimarina sp.]
MKLKKSALLRKNCFVAFTFFGLITWAQNNYTIEYEFIDSDKAILESKLIIQGNESVFVIKDNRESGMTYSEDGTPLSNVINDDLGLFMYSNEYFVYTRIPYPLSRKGTSYKYKANTMNWELTGETKKVGSFICQKASLDFHGRKYQVWFTTEIPVIFGPLNLNGLPGLIVEVIEENGFCSIKLLSFKKISDENLLKNARAFFQKKDIMEYDAYESFMNDFVIEYKIKKAQKISEFLKKHGGTADINLGKGQYHFVRYLIDIPKGTLRELEKIDLY